MPHDGSGTGWDVTAPADTDFVTDGNEEIFDLRKGVGIRIDKEHKTLAAASAGGEHLQGSAKAFKAATGITPPALRPDTVTPLDAEDEGRLLIRERTLWSWDGTAFTEVSPIQLRGNFTVDGVSFSAWIDVEFPFRAILFCAPAADAGMNFNIQCQLVTDEEVRATCIKVGGEIRDYRVQCDQVGQSRFRMVRNTPSGPASDNFRYAVLVGPGPGP